MGLTTVLPIAGGLLCAFLFYAFVFIGRREKGLPPGTCHHSFTEVAGCIAMLGLDMLGADCLVPILRPAHHSHHRQRS
jgi:hypothetical protein